MTPKNKEIFSVPNIMSYFRILLIPVFVFVYLRADSQRDYAVAGVIVAVSGLTDFLDGFIARRFNMVTELGKALDPVADKLTQAAFALCLMLRIPQMGWLFGGAHRQRELYGHFRGNASAVQQKNGRFQVVWQGFDICLFRRGVSPAVFPRGLTAGQNPR